MKAIILSAGQGRRLLPLTEKSPKCALPIGGRSALEWQLHEIARCDIDEVVVVTGFGADTVDDIVARTTALPVRTLYNPFYARCDNLGTCWVARTEMYQPFVIINGDTLFEAAVLRKLLDSGSDLPITLVTDSKAAYDSDDMKVIIEHGRLHRVGKQLDTGSVNGESIGMMCFRDQGPSEFSQKVEHLMRFGEGIKQWYLSAIDELARAGLVAACPIDGLSWCEIDDHADLEHAATVVRAWDSTVDTVASACG
jgi:L-glutamine-phosphate cytidylyltransferase